MIKFRYNGPAETFFSDGRVGDVAPGAEFAVPEDVAVSFALHGHCECLEPDRLAALIDALPDDRAEGIRPLGHVQNARPASTAEPTPQAQPRVASKRKPDISDAATAAQ